MRKKGTRAVDLFFSMNTSSALGGIFCGADGPQLARPSPVPDEQSLRGMGVQGLP